MFRCSSAAAASDLGGLINSVEKRTVRSSKSNVSEGGGGNRDGGHFSGRRELLRPVLVFD